MKFGRLREIERQLELRRQMKAKAGDPTEHYEEDFLNIIELLMQQYPTDSQIEEAVSDASAHKSST